MLRRVSGAGVSSGRTRLHSLAAASFMHFLNDLHPTMLPTFLPEITSRLQLTMAEAGFLNTAFGALNLLVQPLAGYFADKRDKPVFTLWAPMFTAGGAYLLCVAPNYWIALLFVSIMAIGTASFHPQSHGIAGLAGGTENLGAYVAVFSAAGTLGAALSPLYAVGLLRALGRSFIPSMLVPLFALILATSRFLPPKSAAPGSAKGAAQPAPDESFAHSTLRVLHVCLPLVIISIVRDSASQGIRVFLPMLFTQRGGSLEVGGSILFAFTIAQSAATLFGGRMADVLGKTRVIVLMLALSPLFLVPAVFLEGMASVALFVLGGACISATSSVTTAMAQEYLPNSRSAASSLVMGVSWGVANMVAAPIGMLADKIGLTAALGVVATSPLLVVAYIAFNKYARSKSL
jgi:FSR family fosmidomycin resistance protein-like MFS transporter